MDEELAELIDEMHRSRDADQDPFPMKPLKVAPQYGVYPWWPADADWVHPDDLATAEELIPSNRIFRKEWYDETYSLLTYGENFIRVRPVIWLPIEHEGYEIGDWVEVKSQMGKGQPVVAVIHEIRLHTKTRRIHYSLVGHGRAVNRDYTSDEFQLVQGLNSAMDQRQLELLARARLGG